MINVRVRSSLCRLLFDSFISTEISGPPPELAKSDMSVEIIPSASNNSRALESEVRKITLLLQSAMHSYRTQGKSYNNAAFVSDLERSSTMNVYLSLRITTRRCDVYLLNSPSTRSVGIIHDFFFPYGEMSSLYKN